MKTYPVTFVLSRGEGSDMAAALAIWQRQFAYSGTIDLGGCDCELTLSVAWRDCEDPRSDNFVQSYLAVFGEALSDDAASSLTSGAGRAA